MALEFFHLKTCQCHLITSNNIRFFYFFQLYETKTLLILVQGNGHSGVYSLQVRMDSVSSNNGHRTDSVTFLCVC